MLHVVDACQIQGYDSGTCDYGIRDDYDYRVANMPFCAEYVDYVACVPKYKPIAPDRNFPHGRFFNHTILRKDYWLYMMVMGNIRFRVDVELQAANCGKGCDKDVNEWGEFSKDHQDKIVPRFYANRECKKAYMKYACWINFPRCEEPNMESLMVCKTACENFFHSCGYDKDLWRCGDMEHFNKQTGAIDGGDPASTVSSDEKNLGQKGDLFSNKYQADEDAKGQKFFRRDFFPGAPFAAGRNPTDRPYTSVCTGGASSTFLDTRIVVLLLVVFSICTFAGIR